MDENGLFKTKCGTEHYMAPEIHLDQKYLGDKVDIFALGIINFIMYTGHPGFTSAIPTDIHYKALVMDNIEAFWRSHGRGKPGGANYYSQNFRNLQEMIW